MNWIITSIVLIFSSVGLYLTLRSINKYKTPLKIKSLMMFASPLVPLLSYSYYDGISLVISWKYLSILFLSAIFLSWFANMASLRALENAENPGYPLILGKSYVIYTTLFSITFLGGEFSYLKIFLIGMILVFSGMVMIGGESKKNNLDGSPWLGYAIYTFFAWGNLAIILTYLTQKGISSVVLNIYLLGFVTFFILCEMYIKKQKYSFKNRNELLHLVSIGIFFTIFQQAGVYGYSIAPNPGYINTANIASIGLVTLFSSFVFKDHLSKRSLIGIVGIIVCMYFLFT